MEKVTNREAWRTGHLHVPEIAFIVGWAVVIVPLGLGRCAITAIGSSPLPQPSARLSFIHSGSSGLEPRLGRSL
jgi:hypothetical protein